MKKALLILFYFAFAKAISAQASQTQTSVSKHETVEASYLYGTIVEHNPDISHLITGHPTGLFLKYNRKTIGQREWESRFNYPDWGVSALYQDFKNEYLGASYSVYGHMNFYFFKRYLQLSVGTGLAYMTNPYDPETNARNNAYGSRLTNSTYLTTVYHHENLFRGIGLQAGISLVHYSNGNVKSPNSSTNTWFFNLGFNYSINQVDDIKYKKWENKPYKESIHVNAIARIGVNESDIRGSGQYPFYTFSFYADKRISHKSSLHLGTELFISEFLKEYRDYYANSFPNSGIDGDENFQRVGIFIGHELHIGRLGVLAQLGYYIYRPIDFEKRVYNRVGLNYRINDKLFSSLSLKSHAASAEAVSIGIGYRL